ncbi:GNAT family N-acetyltransferase [Spirosoma taeanense]|uniref:GNAT family N-acetyltransferase n=1 Tax=Spirosoma taeanense TaxID=2735870 RepID=A0A6M5YDU6_9BACT|nr:GNAT family N-acetyltransferase [Spirosoma taeanense]QJW91132.1 GNAT family N-acetyltransferase [Spirosoma taeanense]
MPAVSIIPYEPRFQPDFKRLNIEWISRYFTVEPHDLEQLDYPEIYILPKGGQIFLARQENARQGDAENNDGIVGCVAVINTGPTGFELAKMAVSPSVHGQGIGKLLGQAAIEYVRQLGIDTLWLESNRMLMPALTLYARLGFREVPQVPTPYARANIRMEMQL